MSNPRVRKIADRIQVIVAEMLERRIKDPRLGFVTVTDVRVTGDTQQATVFYTVLGEDERPRRHGGRAGVGQGPDPLRGRQAARHAARADAGVHPRRAARRPPATSTSCSPRRASPTPRSRAAARVRRTPARPTRTRSRARTTSSTRLDEPTRVTDATGRAGRRRQAGRDDLARRGRPGPPARRHPQGRPRRHPRPDGHRRAGARRQPGHPAARPPDAHREGVRRHDPARRRHHHRRRRGRGRSRPRPTDDAHRGRRSRGALAAFVGEIEQVPSAVSAIKVDGKRAYAAGARRRGGRARRPGRSPSTSSSSPTCAVARRRARRRRLACAARSGTYVRAIARDLGAALGVGGHLTALRRTAVGPFTPRRRPTPSTRSPTTFALVADRRRGRARCFPSLDLDEEQAARRRLRPQARPGGSPSAGPVAVFAPDGEFLALYEQRGDVAAPVAVFV